MCELLCEACARMRSAHIHALNTHVQISKHASMVYLTRGVCGRHQGHRRVLYRMMRTLTTKKKEKREDVRCPHNNNQQPTNNHHQKNHLVPYNVHCTKHITPQIHTCMTVHTTKTPCHAAIPHNNAQRAVHRCCTTGGGGNTALYEGG